MGPAGGASRIRVTLTGAVAATACLLAALAGGSSAGGAGRQLVFAPLDASPSSENSANWAGYAVTGPADSATTTATTYTSVTGTWREPTVTCGADDAGDASAFWVGLGGFSSASQALEQVGTSADCDPDTGQPSYYAWYELVPANSVDVPNFTIKPGDLITTSVNVIGGTTIEVQVIDRTRHMRFTKELPYATPDLSSADWIAEAPSSCDQFRCRPTGLSDFGTVDFTNIAARGDSVGGTLTVNPGWTTTSISLVPEASGGRGFGFFPGPDTFAGDSSSTAGATPSATSADGRSFSVQWTADSSSSS